MRGAELLKFQFSTSLLRRSAPERRIFRVIVAEDGGYVLQWGDGGRGKPRDLRLNRSVRVERGHTTEAFQKALARFPELVPEASL